ncbi:MAG: PDZ domain-containing protein [Ignavibacteriales bacterium]|nr:PDZ domain-containing protein [Ignavibacteriales bacterium]
MRRHPANVEKADRLDRRRTGWRRSPASGASSPTTASTRTSASRATSRSTSSRASGSRPTRRCAWTCGRARRAATQARRRSRCRPRKALAELPPVFSQQALARRTSRSSRRPSCEGRGLGSRGPRRRPRSTSPTGSRRAGLDARRRRRHVLPALHGRRSAPRARPVDAAQRHRRPAAARTDAWRGPERACSPRTTTTSARGWPDVHKGDEGKVHPGADDNASGVAVMLELARVAGGRRAAAAHDRRSSRSRARRRAGSGSKHYVGAPGVRRSTKTIGVINLDTVGPRSARRKSRRSATGTATEWQHIFRGASLRDRRREPQRARVARVVGPGELHRDGACRPCRSSRRRTPTTTAPRDTADKIDVAGPGEGRGLREGGHRVPRPSGPSRCTNTIKPGPAAVRRRRPLRRQPPAAASAARASRSAPCPDFAFPGPGVQVTGVVPDSPAAKAGIREGDIIMRIDDADVANLQEFSNLLRTLAAGQTVSVVLRPRRRGREGGASTLAER